ncbi:terminase [Pelagerythrobacter aerophilus]|uniref:Terminase n=1 Tax=Pelagerythrobacter aerophilus TaxID=2306995 RepID=A0A418NJR8_9SPHN|nr:terminase [Pelagerythrobacter aerophilus]RIV79561.1 terminase [Pelagerythrobacter aerophilus]
MAKARKQRRTSRTDRARETFLATLAETCNVSEAARTAGIGRSTAYEWRDEDEAFAAAWDEAEQEAADKLEREAWRRAVEGTDKPVTFQGVITATYKEYSDKMLEILLKAHRPEKFTDRSKVEHSGEMQINVLPEDAGL